MPVGDYGYTRLFRAVESGLREHCSALLELGADANACMVPALRLSGPATEEGGSLVRLLVAPSIGRSTRR